MRADHSRVWLRAIGTLGVASTVVTLASFLNFRRYEQPESVSFVDVAHVQMMLSIADLALFVATIVAIALLASSRPSGAGRNLAVAAAALATLRLLVVTLSMFNPPESEAAQQTLLWVYLAMTLVHIASIVLVLLSITTATQRVPIAMVAGAIATMLAIVPRLFPKLPAPMHYGVGLASELTLAVGPLLLAQFTPAPRESMPPGTRGAPLQLLATAFGWRVAIGIVGGVLTGIMVATKNAELAGLWAGVGTFLSVACTVVIVIALVRHLHTEAPGMLAGAVIYAVIAAVVAVVIDVYATKAAIELFEIIAKVQSMTSFGGMPSLSNLEKLQDTVRLASRAQIALGASATFVLAASFRSTAQACGATETAGAALRVMILSVFAAGCAFGLSLLMERPKASEEVLFVGIGALGLGIWLIASWLGLLRELAHALDALDGRPLSAEPARAAS